MKTITHLFVVALLFLGISSSAQAWTPVERYYAGIGAAFWVVDESTLAFYLNGTEYNNRNGAFTERTVVNGLLEGTPAKLAGLKEGDIILSINGNPVEILAGGVHEYIRRYNIGDKVTFSIARPDAEGNAISRHAFEITLGKIDRVAWLPIGHELGGSMGGMVNFAYSYLVTEDVATGEFVYRYTLVNKNDQRIMINWEVLGRLATGWFNGTTILILEPNETLVIETRSTDIPVYLPSSVSEKLEILVWNQKDNLRDYDEPEVNAVRLSRSGYWQMSMGTGTNVLVPAYAAK